MEVTKKDIESLIEIHRSDTYFNHFRNLFTRDWRPTGAIGINEIKIWNPNFWNSSFYPIFHFKFNDSDHLIDITDRLNPVDKTIAFLPMVGLCTAIIYGLVTQEYDRGIWLLIGLGIIVYCLLFLVLRSNYRFEKEQQLEQIFEVLDIETEEKEPEKEWTLKKIITRLFIYSFTIGIIVLGVDIALNNIDLKGIIALVITALICLGYIYIDIRILRENRANRKNKHS